MSEEKRIMDFLGRPVMDGDVRGLHLGKVLMYLKQTRTEAMDETISKLALVLGMNGRYVRENYLKGLTYFKIIECFHNGNVYFWRWIGEKALIISETPFMDSVKEQQKPILKNKIVEHEGYCLNCGNEIPKDKRFCNESCVRKYYDEKKQQKKVKKQNGS